MTIGAATVRVAVTVTVTPADDVRTNVAVYTPAASPVGFALQLSVEETFAASLPPVVSIVSHAADGVLAVQVRVPPPVLVIMIACVAGIAPAIPAVAVKATADVLTCIAAGATIIVIGMVIGLPATLFPLPASVAVMMTFAVYVPLVTPPMFTTTFVVVLVPAASVPATGESEANAGAFASTAFQIMSVPPMLEIFTACAVIHAVAFAVSLPATAASVAGAIAFAVTFTVCGLPAIATPFAVAASAIELVYVPAVNTVPRTATVKVVVSPDATVAEAGVTINQLAPVAYEMLGVIVMLPPHVPFTASVNV